MLDGHPQSCERRGGGTLANCGNMLIYKQLAMNVETEECLS